MKLLLLIFAFVIPSETYNTPNLAAVTKAISDGDASALGAYFENTVEMTVLDKQDVYDSPKAVQVLKDFFTKNKPKAFTPMHQGSSKGNASHYTMGDLSTSGGNYRVVVYYKATTSDKLVIQELRIEKQ
jgi:hypothetical protein